MKDKKTRTIAVIAGMFAVMGGWTIFAQDKYTLKCRMGSRSPSSKDTRPGRLSP